MTILWENNDWSFPLLEETMQHIERIAKDKYNLTYYQPQIEIISAEQMLDNYSSHGMPAMYPHWSFGKSFISNHKSYSEGYMGLAFEIIINSDPAIAYLMEKNTMTMQALVMAHACVGHGGFFKNNYLFKQWTDADAIIDYLVFAKKYIQQCEEKYGPQRVEETLDSCHALMNYGVDKYTKPVKLSKEKIHERQQERAQYLESRVNELWSTLPKSENTDEHKRKFVPDSVENILYFIEKNSPVLETWQREIVRIVRKISQYFAPQMRTKVANEGYATFWHYTLMHDMYDEGLVSEGAMLEFFKNHAAVVYQPDFDSDHYSGINPYYLGFNIFRDIRRICENPTDEDCRWFPDLAGSDWLEANQFAMENFKDTSFIQQYLSPKVMRDMRLLTLLDDAEQEEYIVTDIHDDAGYKNLRKKLALQHDISRFIPDIQVMDFDMMGDRTLYLKHNMVDDVPLEEKSAKETLKHVHRLWGFDVMLESTDASGKVTDTFGHIVD